MTDSVYRVVYFVAQKNKIFHIDILFKTLSASISIKSSNFVDFEDFFFYLYNKGEILTWVNNSVFVLCCIFGFLGFIVTLE